VLWCRGVVGLLGKGYEPGKFRQLVVGGEARGTGPIRADTFDYQARLGVVDLRAT
jgi:hypothetical protein